MYMGTGLTRASARDGAKRMLAIYERAMRRKSSANDGGVKAQKAGEVHRPSFSLLN